MQKKQDKTGLVWFDKNLRSQDNQALFNACKNHEKVIAVYFLDPRAFTTTVFGFKKTAVYRTKFLLETLKDLKETLRKLRITLLVYHNLPETKLPALCRAHDVGTIYHQKEWTAEEDALLQSVSKKLPETVTLQAYYDQFLFHPDDIDLPIDAIPKVFTSFRKYLEKNCSVREPYKVMAKEETNLLTVDHPIPTLELLGFEVPEINANSAFPFKGGEQAAQKRIAAYFFETHNIASYKKTRNGLIGIDYSSKLSAWLANGSISARQIYQQVKAYEKTHQANESTYWIIFELIWRDFFKYIALKHGNAIFMQTGILQKEYTWQHSVDLVEKWIQGKTEEPFVNANMIELKKTGWMSNRGRQNVASYFAKELQLDWRIGAAYFESMLIDYDVHSNYGNWMYVAGVGNDPRDRKFNIELQAKRYDADHAYRDLWLESTTIAE